MSSFDNSTVVDSWKLTVGRWSGRIKPFDVCLEKTGGVSKFEPVVYGDHLLGKVLGNFYSAPTES